MLKFIHARPQDDAANPNPYANKLFWRDVPFETAVLTYATPEGEHIDYTLGLTALAPEYGVVQAREKGEWTSTCATDDDQEEILAKHGHPVMPQNLFGEDIERIYLNTACGHFWIAEPQLLYKGFPKAFKGAVELELIQSGCGGIVLHASAFLFEMRFKDLGAMAFLDQELPNVCSLFDIPFSLERAFKSS